MTRLVKGFKIMTREEWTEELRAMTLQGEGSQAHHSLQTISGPSWAREIQLPSRRRGSVVWEGLPVSGWGDLRSAVGGRGFWADTS